MARGIFALLWSNVLADPSMTAIQKPDDASPVSLGSWCNQSASCASLCPQEGEICPPSSCALNIEGDCCSWRCVDTALASRKWIEYTAWRSATNHSCPPPFCTAHDFMGGLEFDIEGGQIGGIALSHNVSLLGSSAIRAVQTDIAQCDVTVHPVRYAHEMSLRFVDDEGNNLCKKGGFVNGESVSFRCPCPRGHDVQIRCEDSWGDGWHGGFVEVSTDDGASKVQFCADFRSGKLQVETLPSRCALTEVEAEEVTLEELAEVMHDPDAQAQDLDTAKWAAKGYGAIGLGFLGSLASCGVAMGGNAVKAAHPLRHVLLGLDSMANDPFDASEQRQAAQEVIQFTMKDTYDDLNNVSSAVLGCIGNMEENFRKEMENTRERLQVRMQTQDFKKLLTKLFLNTQHRLGRVLDYLTAPGNMTWLAASVEEGLHTCIDVGGLADQVSKRTIVEVINSLPVVNRWFTMCVAFINLSKHLQHYDVGGAAFNARYRTEVFLGRNFLQFYKSTKRTGEVAISKVSRAIRPFELRVLNYLNLVSAKHYHAVNNLTFPHRQGGVAEPAVIAQGFGGAMSYLREYSVGIPQKFATTCRFCRRDGGKTIHYGCWEEEALSFERCVSADGIFYNTSLSVSNAYSCKQYQHWGSRAVSCGGRPPQ